MTPLVWKLVGAVLLAGCVNSSFEVPQTPKWHLYNRGDSREAVDCSGGEIPRACGSRVLPAKIYFDCSDEQFECVFDTTFVMAVPRTGLSPAQKYSVFGSNLTVERCSGAGDSCEVAMVSSKCADAQTCSCRSGMTPALYFYFVRNVGVTVFYSVTEDGALSGPDTKLLMDIRPMYSYYLVGERGFLSMPMGLERANLRTNCRD